VQLYNHIVRGNFPDNSINSSCNTAAILSDLFKPVLVFSLSHSWQAITCTNPIWPDLAFGFVDKRSGYKIRFCLLNEKLGWQYYWNHLFITWSRNERVIQSTFTIHLHYYMDKVITIWVVIFPTDETLFYNGIAGVIAGAVSSAICNPTDVLKVKFKTVQSLNLSLFNLC